MSLVFFGLLPFVLGLLLLLFLESVVLTGAVVRGVILRPGPGPRRDTSVVPSA